MEKLIKPSMSAGEIDLTKLKKICQKYIDFIDDDEEYYYDSDYEHYIFEAAIEAIFGENIWDFINNRQE